MGSPVYLVDKSAHRVYEVDAQGHASVRAALWRDARAGVGASLRWLWNRGNNAS